MLASKLFIRVSSVARYSGPVVCMSANKTRTRFALTPQIPIRRLSSDSDKVKQAAQQIMAVIGGKMPGKAATAAALVAASPLIGDRMREVYDVIGKMAGIPTHVAVERLQEMFQNGIHPAPGIDTAVPISATTTTTAVSLPKAHRRPLQLPSFDKNHSVQSPIDGDSIDQLIEVAIWLEQYPPEITAGELVAILKDYSLAALTKNITSRA